MFRDHWLVNCWTNLDSTNSKASRIAKQPNFINQWILAEQQTTGKGRLGRQWDSPKGNLYATALYKENNGLQAAARVPFIASVAVAETIAAICPNVCVTLKWPNDVIIGSSKVCGILVETGKCDDSAIWIACGIGINVNVAPLNTKQSVTCLANENETTFISVEDVFRKLKKQFECRIQQSYFDFESILERWRSMAIGLKEKIKIRVGDNVIEGIFMDIEQDGALCLSLNDGDTRIIRAGDVSIIRD